MSSSRRISQFGSTWPKGKRSSVHFDTEDDGGYAELWPVSMESYYFDGGVANDNDPTKHALASTAIPTNEQYRDCGLYLIHLFENEEMPDSPSPTGELLSAASPRPLFPLSSVLASGPASPSSSPLLFGDTRSPTKQQSWEDNFAEGGTIPHICHTDMLRGQQHPGTTSAVSSPGGATNKAALSARTDSMPPPDQGESPSATTTSVEAEVNSKVAVPVPPNTPSTMKNKAPRGRPIKLGKVLQCDFPGCEKSEMIFSRPFNLKMHYRTHFERKWRCVEKGCKYTSTRREDVKRHVDGVHDGKKEHKCPNCDRFFSRKDGIKPHMKRKHPTSS